MSALRSDGWIIALVLVASASALAGPLAGSAGFPLAADGFLAGATAAGLGAFGAAALQTWARLRDVRPAADREKEPGC